ncbi:hypothetical protein PROFUN_08083 [Planoprotostelium fungivorum]|uniref:ERCC4 domain-containing protein n=1 Tax=Planoprotostelium fungivorum TaxID=1890364 RepID=A0A2P6NKB7_9EUKA|nr:hypothetical protein PROFUN_08083 [Planoprotostelium fungivorum]
MSGVLNLISSDEEGEDEDDFDLSKPAWLRAIDKKTSEPSKKTKLPSPKKRASSQPSEIHFPIRDTKEHEVPKKQEEEKVIIPPKTSTSTVVPVTIKPPPVCVTLISSDDEPSPPKKDEDTSFEELRSFSQLLSVSPIDHSDDDHSCVDFDGVTAATNGRKKKIEEEDIEPPKKDKKSRKENSQSRDTQESEKRRKKRPSEEEPDRRKLARQEEKERSEVEREVEREVKRKFEEKRKKEEEKDKEKKKKEEEKKRREEEKKKKSEEREREKQRKNEEKEREKENNRKRTPEELMALVKMKIDSRISQTKSGATILQRITTEVGCNTETSTREICNSIEWEVASPNDPNSVRMIDKVLVFLTGDVYVNLLKTSKFHEFVRKVRNNQEGRKVIYLIEGINRALSHEQRQGSKALRNITEEEEGVVIIGKAEIEKSFIWLQIEAEAHVHTTGGVDTTFEYIYNMTKIFSLPPEEETSSNFHLGSVIRLRDEPAWVAQLVQIPGLAVQTAKAIARVYPSLGHLMRAYEDGGGGEVLADVEKGGRKIGPSLSNKIYRYFTEENGNTLIEDLK